MELRISHSCPSCGGPVEMTEADRLSNCVFCDVPNYMVDTGLQRFVLPDKVPEHIPRDRVLYFPYLRFKGNIFTCQGREIGYKVMDTTHQGVASGLLPITLGLRPQAMKVLPVGPDHTGLFVRREETAVKILQRASILANAFSEMDDGSLHHRAFIGETVSCIYLPIYIENEIVYDGVLNRKLGIAEPWMKDDSWLVRYRHDWQPNFIATICPQCGAGMEGESDSLILHCYNCNSNWAEKKGKFVPVPYTQVVSKKPETINIPFWRISAEASGIKIQTIADFLTITNQPIVVNWKHEENDLEFWVPAIKLRPKIYLKLAKSATLTQLNLPEGEKKLKKPLFPVTMSLKEATQSLKSILAESTVNKKDVLPKLPSITFSIKQTSLAYLPFEDTGHDLVQEHSALSIASTIVQQGRKL